MRKTKKKIRTWTSLCLSLSTENHRLPPQHYHCEPPSMTTSPPPGQPLSSFIFFSTLGHPPLFCKWIVESSSTVYYAGLDQDGRAESGPVQNKIQKIPFKIFVIFPCIFLSILLNIGLYFYTVKIQIRY
jgi:hypothetical protein